MILFNRIVCAFDAEVDRILAISAGACDAVPVWMWWKRGRVAFRLIQRAVISDDEITLVIDGALDVVLHDVQLARM